MEFSKKKSLFKKSLFLTAGLLAVSLNVSPMTDGMGELANNRLMGQRLIFHPDPSEGVLWATGKLLGGGLAYCGWKVVSGLSWVCGKAGLTGSQQHLVSSHMLQLFLYT